MPEDEPEDLVNIRMSPQHAKILALMLNKNIKKYEQEIGEIKILPALIKDLKLNMSWLQNFNKNFLKDYNSLQSSRATVI